MRDRGRAVLSLVLGSLLAWMTSDAASTLAAVPGPAATLEGGAAEVPFAACEPAPASCTWTRHIGSPFEDKLYAIAPLDDGGAVVAGSTRAHAVAGFDGWVVRLDRTGRDLWQRRVGGDDTEQFYGIAAADDGGVYVAGHTRSEGAGESDLWIERLDRSGNRLWQRTLGGAGNDRIRALAGTSDGGIVAVGFSASNPAQGRDLWVVRLEPSGGVAWETRLGGPLDEMGHVLASDGAGGTIVGGYRRLPDGAAGFDWWIIGLDADGAVRWERTFDRSSFDIVTAMTPAGDGGVVVAGATGGSDDPAAEGSGTGRLDVTLARLDPTGNVLWERRLGGAGDDTASGLTATSDGFVLAGSTNSYGAGSADAWLNAVDMMGEVLWTRTYGGALWDRATAVRADAADGLWVVGYSTSDGAGFEDGWILRLDALGRP